MEKVYVDKKNNFVCYDNLKLEETNFKIAIIYFIIAGILIVIKIIIITSMEKKNNYTELNIVDNQSFTKVINENKNIMNFGDEYLWIINI